MKSILFTLLFLVSLISINNLTARPLTVTFTPSISESYGIVQGYNLYYQSTNSSNTNILIGSCLVGQTNIYLDSTNIPINPVFLSATTVSTNGLESSYSSPVLLDINHYVPLPPSIIHIYVANH